MKFNPNLYSLSQDIKQTDGQIDSRENIIPKHYHVAGYKNK